jgi:hypothetical protein
MRLIVALALVPFAAAQTSREKNIARMEANVAAHPDDARERERIIQTYFARPNVPPEPGELEGRRRHILWMIENRSDWPALATFPFDLSPYGVKADPAGHEQAAQLWRSRLSDLSPKAAANAAWFFKVSDRTLARSLVENNLNEPACAGVLGVLNVLEWLGATELDSNGSIDRTDPARRHQASHEAIERSENPVLLGRAGEFILRQSGAAVRSVIEPPELADIAARWLGKAHRLDATNPMWSSGLAEARMRQAGAVLDPHAKVQLLSEAMESANDNQKARVLGLLVDAEYRAGEDAAAERHARALLDFKDADSAFTAHTTLGRVALARGDVDEAKRELLDSARSKGSPALNSFGPRMTLAQDLLDHGEKDAVVEYLELCRAFWKSDRGFIDHFEPIVKKGGKPDLTAPYLSNPPQIPKMPAPEIIPGSQPMWKPVNGAESYVVEWDSQDNGRWNFDVDGTVRVVPTRDVTVTIDGTGKIRWRVYAVGRGGSGTATTWIYLQ